MKNPQHLDTGWVVTDLTDIANRKALLGEGDGGVRGPATGIEDHALDLNLGPKRELLNIIMATDVAPSLQGLPYKKDVLGRRTECQDFEILISHLSVIIAVMIGLAIAYGWALPAAL